MYIICLTYTQCNMHSYKVHYTAQIEHRSYNINIYTDIKLKKKRFTAADCKNRTIVGIVVLISYIYLELLDVVHHYSEAINRSV